MVAALFTWVNGGLSSDEGRPRTTVQEDAMRFGRMEVRPLGGGMGCLGMILVSVFLSVVGTIVLNLLLR